MERREVLKVTALAAATAVASRKSLAQVASNAPAQGPAVDPNVSRRVGSDVH